MRRSIAFNIFFYGFTAGIAVLSLPLLILPRALTVRMFEIWAAGVRWGLKTFAGIEIEIRHREKLDRAMAMGPVIIASKHQSMLDTVMLNLIFPDPAIVMKRELLYVPLYGLYALKAGMLVVDRQGHAKALRKLLNEAKKYLEAGRPLFIYPEGTRSKAGEKSSYKPGIAAIYGQLNLVCVPMALNSGLCWGPREFAKRPGRVVFEFLEPIEAGLNRRAFMARLEAEIEAGTDRLLAEAKGLTPPAA
jgi:1-acyl-sn-glycerol-3-phosphate acyltransferase